MENAQQLANRFREVMLNGKWIANTNFQDQLSQTNWEQATQKVASLNTIAALTFHVNYYIAGLNDFFDNGRLEIRDQYSFDVPVVKSQEAWDTLVQALLNNSEVFAKHVERFSNEQLESIFVDEKYGKYRRNIEGMIEHAYYHLGQIALIRKLLSSSV